MISLKSILTAGPVQCEKTLLSIKNREWSQNAKNRTVSVNYRSERLLPQ